MRVLNGGVLYLTLSARYRGKWTIRYMITRKVREIGIGWYPEFSLAATLKKQFEAHILIAEGKDPLTERRSAQALATTTRFFGQLGYDLVRCVNS